MEDTNIREAALAHAKDLHTTITHDRNSYISTETVSEGIDEVLSDAQTIYEFLTNSHQTEPATGENLPRGFALSAEEADAFLRGQRAPARNSDYSKGSYIAGRNAALDELLSLGREAHYEADSLVRGSVVLSAIDQVRARA